MRVAILLLLLPFVVGVAEKFEAEVSGLECTFAMIYKGTKVDMKKSKVLCSKPKKTVKFTGEITSDSGTVFTISLIVTKKGARLQKAVVSSGSGPTPVGGSGSGTIGGSGRPPPGGSGSGRPPTGGSGSGRPPVGGSGSGRPPIGGSGSGGPPGVGSGSGGGGSPGTMQCSCQCRCPDGTEDCDCDCDCPTGPTSSRGCGQGFTRVCPSTGSGQCPPRMASICPGGGSRPQAGSGSGGNRPPGGGSGSGGNRPPGGGSGSGGNRPPPSGRMSPPVLGGTNGMTTELSAEGCTCMPSLMVMMTKLTAEQMGGHGQGGNGGMGGSRPPMGGSGSGGPPHGPPPPGPMGSGSGGNRPPSGSGSGRPPMGGSGSGSGPPPMGGSGSQPPPAGRAAKPQKPQWLRESFSAEVTVGKKTYECKFSMRYTTDRVDKKSKARCKGIRKGAVKQVTVTSPNGYSFTMDLKFSSKGVAMSKITVEAGSSSSGSGGPSITGPSGSGRPPVGGSGSGRPPTGSGSGRPPVGGSGSGGPPTGGSGSGRPPVGGSGSGRPPTGGSGSGRPPIGGSGSGGPPTGGSGSGRPPIGGSGSGSGGPPTGGIGSDMCFCVDEEMLNGPMGGNGGNGGGPPGGGAPGSGRPPTGGSGSGSGRPPVGGSGSGSGSGRPPVGGSGSGSSGGSGSGNGSGGSGSGTGVVGNPHFHTPSDAYHQAMVEAVQGLTSSTVACMARSPGCSGNCENNPGVSYYSEIVSGSTRSVMANGIPNHSYESDATNPNPNRACEQRVVMNLPANPSKGSYEVSNMGPVGLSVSGGFIFNHLSNQMGDLAVPNEGPSLDSCMGHSERTCRYHYHDVNTGGSCHQIIPTNITVSGASCSIVGWMLDGFPLLTCLDAAGQPVLKSCYTGSGTNAAGYSWAMSSNCHLDEANGYDFPDGYAYLVTETYPWVPNGFMGSEKTTICYLDGSSSGGGGGPPGNGGGGGSGQRPPPGGSGQRPPPGGSGQRPPPGGSGQRPPPGGSGQRPPPGK